MGIRFRITHTPKSQHAKKFRYAIVYNRSVLVTSEGYPTYQHVMRAVNGVFKGMAKIFGIHNELGSGMKSIHDHSIPFTADSYKPKTSD